MRRSSFTIARAALISIAKYREKNDKEEEGWRQVNAYEVHNDRVRMISVGDRRE